MSATPSVTTLWEAYRQMIQTADALNGVSNSKELDAHTMHPLDAVNFAAFRTLPAILAIPARSVPEAMMQICALGGIMGCEAGFSGPWHEQDVHLWFGAIASIMRALNDGGALPDCRISDMFGQDTLNAINTRLLEMEKAA